MPDRPRGIIRPYAPALVELSRVLDAAWIVCALWVASVIHGAAWLPRHTLLAFLAVAIFWIAANNLYLYRSWRASTLRAEMLCLWSCWSISALIIAFVVYAFDPLSGQRESLLFAWFGIVFLLLGVTRVGVRLGLRLLRLRGRNFRTVAIVGATRLGKHVAQTISDRVWMGLRVIGYFDDRHIAPGRTTAEGVELRGNLQELTDLARRGEVDYVYIVLPLRAEMRVKELMARLSDTTVSVFLVPDFSNFELLNAHWDTLGNFPVVGIVHSPFHGTEGVSKRVMDVCLSLVILSVIALPMLLIAGAIKLTSTGPVLFRQRRYGLDGKEFEIWKFRTMTVCEDGGEFRQATANDPRVTPLGAFLRRTSLDELPQFINVLQGRMSVVGPRPHPVALNEQQRSLINGYMWRHKVKPGITGWAQVNGYRGETDTRDKMEGRIKLDLEYIDRWSLWMDIKIILLTLRTVVRGKNAY